MVDMLYFQSHDMSTNLYTGDSIVLSEFYKDQDKSWKAEGRFLSPKKFMNLRQDSSRLGGHLKLGENWRCLSKIHNIPPHRKTLQ